MLYKTLYFPVGRFFDKAKLARIDGSYLKWIGNINKAELLILDDFGTAPIDQQSRNLLMDVIDNRYESSSIILTSQIPVSGWHALIGEATIADAILDRLVYSSHRIELEGESLRKKKKLST
jgi:DNA replication protein DnaC